MLTKIKTKIGSFKFTRFVWTSFYFLFKDILSGRFRGVLFIGLGNLLPDLLSCSVVRPLLWRLAGVQLTNYSNTVIRKGVFTEYPSNLKIGKNFQINRNSYLDSNGQILIGNFVMISINCSILTISHSGLNHEIDNISPVTIKDHCLIYANCTILPGTILEEGVVLAAGSVIKGNTKPWSIYAGVPAKLIKSRERVR